MAGIGSGLRQTGEETPDEIVGADAIPSGDAPDQVSGETIAVDGG
jgi:hypothetical protein